MDKREDKMRKLMRIFLSILTVLSLSAVLFCCKERNNTTEEETAVQTTPAVEQATASDEEPDQYAYTPPCRECDRDMLVKAVESYIAAQKSGNLSEMALAEDVAYKENMSEVTKDKGLWNTSLPIAFHRSIYDVPRCKTFTEIIVTEGGHPYVIGTRLTVDKGKVTGIDSLVTDKGDWLFDAGVYLKYSKAKTLT